MTWEYNQRTGEMTHNGSHYANGYSGSPEGKNDPSKEHVGFVGPIPRGYWRITRHTRSKGNWTIELEPVAGTNTFGRDAFRIHGDNAKTLGSSSEGCIIINGANVRRNIFNSGDDILVVR